MPVFLSWLCFSLVSFDLMLSQQLSFQWHFVKFNFMSLVLHFLHCDVAGESLVKSLPEASANTEMKIDLFVNEQWLLLLWSVKIKKFRLFQGSARPGYEGQHWYKGVGREMPAGSVAESVWAALRSCGGKASLVWCWESPHVGVTTSWALQTAGDLMPALTAVIERRNWHQSSPRLSDSARHFVSVTCALKGNWWDLFPWSCRKTGTWAGQERNGRSPCYCNYWHW